MFGITEQKRKVFNSNFLRSVFFKIEYESTEVDPNAFEKTLNQIFSEGFVIQKSNLGFGVSMKFEGGKPIVEAINESEFNGFQLKSLNGKINLTFGKNSMDLMIQGSNYYSFDYNKELLDKVNQTIEAQKFKNIKKVSIRKLNIVEFEKTNDFNEPPIELLNVLLNKNLLCNFSYLDRNTILNNFSSFSLIEGDFEMNLKYGYNSPNSIDNENKHLIIDIEISKNKKFQQNLTLDFEEINNLVYNTFVWCISDEFKEILERNAT